MSFTSIIHKYTDNQGQEKIKLTPNSLVMQIQVIIGQDGDYWVCVSPSLKISAYGDTKEEAEKNFEEHLNLFREDLFGLDPGQRVLELKKLGWTQKKYHKRQFSKAFVDENGMLQNLKHAEISTHVTTAA